MGAFVCPWINRPWINNETLRRLSQTTGIYSGCRARSGFC